ncbi:polysaccharide pyruvyl transferase family protein [Falsiroseomonas selenitidurans]|uniref:Polysaccharide pyruvyl transferase family protein n=1 Tax=Falsiroseomonas selenitidurans TaxID=2716335 RepID=A0ABX1E994_9PROT|nr:polysaccharide pyruvyl transferase family protein [Falsiroseomonas selenitidurans]NKC32077.1 polysaccharide pyruvyl transferase family protein [Falsiroseomonas selenitidurans]
MPETDGNARSVMLVNDTRPDRHYGCQAVVEGLLVFLARAGLRIPSFHPVGKPWTADPTFHERIAQVSAVVVNGEGSIHHSNARAQALAQIGSLCRQTLRVPSILLNATLEANDARVYTHLAQYDLVQVRDRQSFAELAAFGLAKPLYCPDFSMYHDFASARTVPPSEPPARIGVTDSILPKVSAQLQTMKTDKGFVACDIRIPPNQPTTIYDYAARMAGLDLLVTGRYHAVCFAINTGTPFVAIESNTKKISNLLQDVFGDTRRVIQPEAVSGLRVEEYAGWSAKEADDLARFAQERPKHYAALAQAVAETARRAKAA